tara:strand:+ start:408 stop:1253 length:846 start_codon:yes stop_codon:yes gene_type:complete
VNLILPKIITGGSLESLFYAYIHETPIVLTQPYVPFELDMIEDNSFFELLGYTAEMPLTKVQVWDRLAFVLSMAGLVMMPNNVRSVRHERNKIVFSLNDNSRFIIAYERKISFDKHLDSEVDVYDWFDIRSGAKTEKQEINDSENDLVHKIIFYDSQRKGTGGKGFKDLVSLSRMQTSELHEYENSESYVRLKTLQMMKEQGMRGRPNGYNKRGIQQFYAINIEHMHREIIKRYEPKFTMQEALSQVRQEKEIWKLTKKLLHQKQISILRESSRLRVDKLV